MADITEFTGHIAGIGHVFYNDVDADPIDLAAFDFSKPATFGDWTWLGDTSSENLIEFDKDGGDVTNKRTWDRLNTGVSREPTSRSCVINAVNTSRDTFALGFSDYEYDEETDSYAVGSSLVAAEKAIQIISEEGALVASLYLYKTSIIGDLPTFDLEEYMEWPLNVALLDSPTKAKQFRWFPPRSRTGITAPEGQSLMAARSGAVESAKSSKA
ncbi:hypothetical protein [Brachybacterium kimchii]|uniref:Major tail protein n=1 Tax=Brachybacterium kimchii TaxID=2942909 RepID=A0ABY4NBF3_9MICO|nr:hypothetical protein [Brachybacterium kimchii]UQN30655.1 hypothetical protein M4486_04960 [Brachybacterium kimchii]